MDLVVLDVGVDGVGASGSEGQPGSGFPLVVEPAPPVRVSEANESDEVGGGDPAK